MDASTQSLDFPVIASNDIAGGEREREIYTQQRYKKHKA
jgi:hypothetical protein